MKERDILFLGIIFYIVSAYNIIPPLYAEEARHKKDNNAFFSNLSENLIFKKEILTTIEYSDALEKWSQKSEVGFDSLKTFTGDYGDWATMILQMRLVRRDNQFSVPAHVEGEHDWELETHEAVFRWTGFSRGGAGFRIGHFDVPYGLEQNIDTHTQDLIQLNTMRNLGVKKDWGMSIGGQMPNLDYEFALTRGSGVNYIDRGDNFIISGRVGTPSTENFFIGLSAFYGQIIDSQGVIRLGNVSKFGDSIVRKYRVGIDSLYIYGPYTFKGELSYGEDVDQEVINTLLEVDYILANDRLEIIAQIQSAYQDVTSAGENDDTFALLGFNFRLSPIVTLRGSYRHDFNRIREVEEDDRFALQVYYYF